MIWLILSIGIWSNTPPVDMVEVNHYYNEKDELIFTQVIYYEWKHDYCRFDVMKWHMLENTKIHKQGNWFYINNWEATPPIRVKTKRLRTSHTYYDPERLNQKLTHPDQRTDLCTTPSTKKQ